MIILLLSVFLIDGQSQGKEKSLEFLQKADSIVLLDEVKVEAYRVPGRLHNIPGSLSVIYGEGLQQSGSSNLTTILNTLPGVSIQSGTYATNRIVIRGMGSRTPYNSNRIRAYLNDIPVTSSDGVSTPEETDLQSLGKIEVIKGPSSALYGSGLGGSINLYTPEKTENEGNIIAGYESFNTGKAHLSATLKKDKVRIWGSFNHLQSEGYRENNNYKRTSLLATAQLLQPRWSVNTTLMLTSINGGIPSSLGITLFENNPRAAAPNWKEIEGYKKNRKGLAAITLNNNISGHLSNQITLFVKGNDSYEKRPFNNLDDQSISSGLRNKVSFKTAKTDIAAGVEWLTEEYEWSLDKDEILLNENRENRLHLNIFGMVYYRPVPKLNISVAGALNNVRYKLSDLFPSNGDQSGKRTFPVIFSPRFGINYAPNNLFAVYSSVGHGFSLPSPEETLLPAGDVNPDIMPEQGMQYEIGTRLNLLDKKVEIDCAIYWIELNNLLLTKRITEDIFTGMNAGKTRHQGLELQLRNRWFDTGNFPGQLTSMLSYTRSVNKFIDFTDDGNVYNGNNLPGIPDQFLHLLVTWRVLKYVEINTEFQHTGNQYLNDNNSLKYTDYTIGNLKIATRFDLKKAGILNIYAGINNISDTRYASMLIVNAQALNNTEPRYYYPGLPRHFIAGIQLRLAN
jgi:iron complex outermembrane receptor protein